MRIRKGNVELDIDKDFAQSYINQGYDVIDDKGNILTAGNAAYDIDLPKKYHQAQKEISQLKEEIIQLRNQIVNLELIAKEKPTKSTKKS